MALYALGDSVPETPGDGEYWVAPDAQVMGRVVLHRNASVWYGAGVRGDPLGASVVHDGDALHQLALRRLRAARLSRPDRPAYRPQAFAGTPRLSRHGRAGCVVWASWPAQQAPKLVDYGVSNEQERGKEASEGVC